MASLPVSANEASALRAFCGEVRERFGDRVRALSLVGSRARGSAGDTGELELLVLVRDLTHEERQQVLDLGTDVGRRSAVALAPLVADASTWRSDFPLAQVIAAEGVPL